PAVGGVGGGEAARRVGGVGLERVGGGLGVGAVVDRQAMAKAAAALDHQAARGDGVAEGEVQNEDVVVAGAAQVERVGREQGGVVDRGGAAVDENVHLERVLGIAADGEGVVLAVVGGGAGGRGRFLAVGGLGG